MTTLKSSKPLKDKVREFWDADPCGTRDLQHGSDFQSHAEKRYSREPFIKQFANFSSAREKNVLEIGVGMGADYVEWLKAGAYATGVDLSEVSLSRARRRSELQGYRPALTVADAENLPFVDNTFDIVYSYGVMHHSPDTQKCIDEALRVLKPGGEIRLMLYHNPSLTGLMLWLRFGLISARSIRQTVYHHLESPGTKSFSAHEVQTMMGGFRDINTRVVFSPGDLLMNTSSAKFQGSFYRAIWRLYPRALVKRFCKQLGLFMLVSAQKPTADQSRPDYA